MSFGGITLGTGGRGSISFGTGGIRVTPGHTGGRGDGIVPDYHGHRPHYRPHEMDNQHWRPREPVHHHVMPQPWPQARPQPWPQPQPQPQPLPEPQPQIRPNEVPAEPQLPPAAIEPESNPIELTGRQITEEEIVRAKEFFQRRLLKLASALESRLPPAEYDLKELVDLMAKHKFPAKTQIQIIDALEAGDLETAGRIWITVVPGLKVPFRPCRIKILFIKIYLAIERGEVWYPHVHELITSLPPEVITTTCCGVDDLLVQIEEEVKVNQAIVGTAFDRPNKFRKPGPYQNTNFGKPNGYGKPQKLGKPGQTVPLPAGPVNIVFHPKLPDGSVVVVNSQTVMVGTGGQGVFRTEYGRVAEVLGHRMATGSPLPGNRSELIRSGTVIVNPTHAEVNFVFGGHELALEPGFRQIFRTGKPKVISFDPGNRKETVRYTLAPGSYHFEVGQDGWNVKSRKYEVTVSNEGNLKPFRYIVQGEHVTVNPEATNTHTSDYPIIIRFDRGNDTATRQVRWTKSKGTVQVAVNPSDNLWDLYAASAVESQEVLKPQPEYVPAF